MQKELSNPNFCFLRRDDPYRPYYEIKITEFARGGTWDKNIYILGPVAEEEEEGKAKQAPSKQTQQPKKVTKDPPKDQYTVE